MNEEIDDLLREIQGWMLENDHEDSKEGAELYARIEKILGQEEK